MAPDRLRGVGQNAGVREPGVDFHDPMTSTVEPQRGDEVASAPQVIRIVVRSSLLGCSLVDDQAQDEIGRDPLGSLVGQGFTSREHVRESPLAVAPAVEQWSVIDSGDLRLRVPVTYNEAPALACELCLPQLLSLLACERECPYNPRRAEPSRWSAVAVRPVRLPMPVAGRSGQKASQTH